MQFPLKKASSENLLPAEREVPIGEDLIQKAAERSRRLVTKRALISAGASALPVPGADIAVDIGVMTSILTSVNQEFGLTQEQINRLPTEKRLKLFSIITAVGGTFAGKIITVPIVTAALRHVGVQLTAKQASRWVPIIGTAVSASVSFTALKFVGNQHIEDCVRISRMLTEWQREQSS